MTTAFQRVMKYINAINPRSFDRLMNKVKIIAADNGTCVAEFKVEEEHSNFVGTLHGSFTAMLVDNISTCALAGVLGKRLHISACMDISYLRPAKQGDLVVVDSKVLKTGNKLAFIFVTLKNKQTGELLAQGTHTKCILDGESNLL